MVITPTTKAANMGGSTPPHDLNQTQNGDGDEREIADVRGVILFVHLEEKGSNFSFHGVEATRLSSG